MSFDITTAAKMLSAMQGRTVLLIGDVMLDRFVDGHVSRISPEAPVPVLGQRGKGVVAVPFFVQPFLNQGLKRIVERLCTLLFLLIVAVAELFANQVQEI